jgi:hypothetical protein
MEKFIHLNVSHLRLEDLAGLTSETIVLAAPQTSALGPVGTAKLEQLEVNNDALMALLNKERASPLTAQITEEDKLRDALFSDIKRTASAAAKSTDTEKAAAGAKLVELLSPFWKLNARPMMTQTTQLNLLATRYQSDHEAINAAAVIGLTTVIANLFATNTSLFNLYNQRLSEMSDIEGPSATSVKSNLVKSYDEFCVSVELILSALATEALQKLFYEMNDIRRKYISHLPTPLDEEHTSVASIPAQLYSGKAITPIPQVFLQTSTGTIELVFAEDFTVTYKNNIKVGEAKLSVHGKGKYTGRYDTTFHIIEENR